MAASVDDSLTALEKMMLDAVEKEWERWEEAASPLPAPLVNMLRIAHDALMKRANRMAGDDGLIAKSPEVALLRIERLREQCLRAISKKNEGIAVS